MYIYISNRENAFFFSFLIFIKIFNFISIKLFTKHLVGFIIEEGGQTGISVNKKKQKQRCNY